MIKEYLSEKLRIISFSSMIMVVFLHSYNLGDEIIKSNTSSADRNFVFFLQYFISQGIARVAVPIFFAISGYLFFVNKKNTFSDYVVNLQKRFKSLVVPYLFWSISFFLFFLFLQLLPQTASLFKQKLIINYSAKEILETIFIHPIPFQFWFIRDLFVFVLLAPLIYLSIKCLRALFMILLLILWFLHFDFVIFSCEALLFFSFGSFLAINSCPLEKSYYYRNNIVLIILWVLAVTLETMLVYQSYENEYIMHALHKMTILLGVSGIWFFYDFLYQRSKFSGLKFFSFASMSFFVYAFHEPLLEVLKVIFYHIIGKSQLSMLFSYILLPIFVISISIYLGLFLKRFLPNFFKIITGGR